MTNEELIVTFLKMKERNAPEYEFPVPWDRITRPYCSRCGSDEVCEKSVGSKTLKLVQCISAVRYYSIKPN